MTRKEFEQLSKNDMPAALVWLFDQLEAAELTAAALLEEGGDSQTEAEGYASIE